jgi:hypothetical protein
MPGRKVIILGNGISRKGLDLHLLKDWAQVWGCNDMYTEEKTFVPHRLFATDGRVLKRIQASGYAQRHPVFVNGNNVQRQEACPDAYCFMERVGNCTGNGAIWCACIEGYDEVYLVGFDLYIEHRNMAHHIYGRREGYGTSTVNVWVTQMGGFFRSYPQIQFFKVGKEGDPHPKLMGPNEGNLHYITREEFIHRVLQ